MAELTISKEKPETLFKRACGCFVVVRRDHMGPSTKSGLVLTRGAVAELQQEVATGEVICVGDGSNPHGKGTSMAAPCKGGERIIWSRYGERIVEHRDDGDIVAVPFPEIIGVIC